MDDHAHHLNYRNDERQAMQLPAEYADADPRFQRAILREMRQTDALRRTIELISTHPDVCPVERLHIVRSLSSLDRRGR